MCSSDYPIFESKINEEVLIEYAFIAFVKLSIEFYVEEFKIAFTEKCELEYRDKLIVGRIGSFNGHLESKNQTCGYSKRELKYRKKNEIDSASQNFWFITILTQRKKLPYKCFFFIFRALVEIFMEKTKPVII